MAVNSELLLSEIFDICDKLYHEMCVPKQNDHAALFAYLTGLGKLIANADRASFWKWDKRKNTLWTMSATGTGRIEIPDTTGLVGKAMREKRIVITNDPYSDPDFNPSVDKKTGYVTKSVLVMPVADLNGNYIGAFQIINKFSENGFSEDDVHGLSLAALICGIALESETFLEESHHDKLTKLKNRMGFYSDFSKKYQAVLDSGRPLSMFICDIDKFKRVNDTYGHNAGDDVLSFTAGQLSGACRENDSIYRWGGEEFIMLMPDTELAESVDIANAIREKIAASEVTADGNTLTVTMSFGCHKFEPGLTIEENISRADEHLYAAKEGGRNRVVF
jgi:diguanylate cyclase (GGDEF)-like protein